MTKPLNIGMVGYGFMGRAHSNAYSQVNHFFDLAYRPVLKAVCARMPTRRRRSPTKWGYESIETDWKKLVARKDIDAIDICTPNNLPTKSPSPRPKAGKMVLCEKPLAMNGARRAEDGRRRREGEACRTWSGTTTDAFRPSRWPSSSSTTANSGRSSIIGPISCRTGRFRPICRRVAPALASRCRGGRQRRHRRSPGALHRYRALAQRRHANVSAHDRDFHQGAQAQSHRQSRKGRASTTPARFCAGSTTVRSAYFESTRYARGHKALYTFEINGEKASIKWDLHDLHRLQYFDHGDESILRGWRSIHVTDGDHPYMDKWWVPGPADRLRAHVRPSGGRFPEGLETGKPAGPDIPRCSGNPESVRRRARQRQEKAMGQGEMILELDSNSGLTFIPCEKPAIMRVSRLAEGVGRSGGPTPPASRFA